MMSCFVYKSDETIKSDHLVLKMAETGLLTLKEVGHLTLKCPQVTNFRKLVVIFDHFLTKGMCKCCTTF